MKLDPYLTSYTPKINSKWIKALNVKYKTLRRKHHDIGFDNNFLDMIPKTQARK